MPRIRKCTSVQVIYQGARSLVPALPAAEYDAGLLLSVVFQRFDRIHKSVRRPGVVLFVNIFQGAGRLKHVVIDRHAVSRHAEGIHIIFPIAVPACIADIFIDIVRHLIFFPEVAEIGHQPFVSPVSDHPFRTLQDQVGSLAFFYGLTDLLITGGIIQVLDRYVDFRVLLHKVRDQPCHYHGIPPVSHRIGPQGNLRHAVSRSFASAGGRAALLVLLRASVRSLRVSASARIAGRSSAGGTAGSQAGRQQQSQHFLHVLISPFFHNCYTERRIRLPLNRIGCIPPCEQYLSSL